MAGKSGGGGKDTGDDGCAWVWDGGWLWDRGEASALKVTGMLGEGLAIKKRREGTGAVGCWVESALDLTCRSEVATVALEASGGGGGGSSISSSSVSSC